MKRALALVMLVSGCDLDLFGAYDTYCMTHACDGGTSSAGGGTSSVGGGTGGSGGGTSSTGGGTSGTGGGATGGGDGGTNPLDTWCDRYTHALCDRALRCGENGAANCFSLTLPECHRGQEKRARYGSLRYVEDGGVACLGAIAASSCTNLPVCTDVFLPNAHQGERCDDGDCVAGLYCPSAFGSATCAACKPFETVDGPCLVVGFDGPCAPGLYCGNATDGGIRCLTPIADGQRCLHGFSQTECASRDCVNYDGGNEFFCGHLPLNTPCSLLEVCGHDAYCMGWIQGGNTFQTGSCKPRKPLGSSCVDEQYDDGCSDGGTCLGSVCTVATDLPTGAPCDRYNQCASRFCDKDGLFSDGGPWIGPGTCVSFAADAGDACLAGMNCERGYYCDGATCVRTIDAGATCVGGILAECGAYYCVGPYDGGQKCGLLPGRGEPCPSGTCTGTGVFCVSYDGGAPICQGRPIGGGCGGPFPCESGRCGAGMMCAPSCYE